MQRTFVPAAIVLAALFLSGSAFAQKIQRQRDVRIVPPLRSAAVLGGNPGPTESVSPNNVEQGPGIVSKQKDEEVVLLKLPPLDEIQTAMPHSKDGISNPEGSWGLRFHDAERDETRDLPVVEGMDNERLIESPFGSFGGAYPSEDSLPELRRSLGQMSVVGGLDQVPARFNVKLLMRFEDSNGNDLWSVCSGSMQDSGVVLTAAHCVYMRGSGVDDFAEEVFIFPGWDGNGNLFDDSAVFQNFGFARSTQFLAGSDYIDNGNFDRDCGMIRINRGSSRNVGMLTGWFGWASGGGCDTTTNYSNFSYPAEAPCHTGDTMYFRSGTWDGCFGNQHVTSTDASCLGALWGGMSGSGAYYLSGESRFVHSIASNSNRQTFGRYCKMWSQFSTDLQTFESDTRGTTFDLELLRCRTTGNTTVQAGTAMDAQLQVLVSNATNADPAAQTFTLRVYLSTNNNISSADTLLSTLTYSNVDFAAMQNRTFNIPAPVIPASVSAGSYWIGAILDDGTDSISSNNDTDTWDADEVVVTQAPPVNDNWIGTSVVDFATGTNEAATEEANEPNLSPAGATVWWWYQAPEDGVLTIDTFGSDFDTMLHVYSDVTSGFATWELEDDDDDTSGAQSEVSFAVEAGKFYDIRVSGYNGATGQIELNVDFTPTTLLGDANGDGSFDFADIDGFVLALLDPVAYAAQYPSVDPDVTLDMDGNGSLGFEDIDPFLEALLN